ncbi:hypothetical protein [Chryseobacterium taiwanense]|uniref:Uncharacterized protein n=1 Tax=Chryseobacterium taiwanense TaxID=363331 RepID=A0A0B4CJU2_9FLAO|nr:hypothetical protein [Chryseobacterium taiwanense]KIC61534.1 hypothetical protein RM51_17130 [Chryseobacterium taiwanense]
MSLSSIKIFSKIIISLVVIFLVMSCKSPKEKIEDVVLYQDSIGYWNYEWSRERAEYYGFTFKFMKKNKLQKLSFNKVKNRRTIWNDYPYEESIYRWGVADDSIFTLMNYNSKIKVTKYNKDTIWLYDPETKSKDLLIKVKGDLNIEKPVEIKGINKDTGEEIQSLNL